MNIIPITSQKSWGIPIIGIFSVFIPNNDEIKVSGNVIKATIVSIFIISFVFVVRSESFVIRKSKTVSLCPSIIFATL